MNVSKNGIRVVQPGQSATKKRREPLEYALEMIEFYMIIDGVEHNIVVPKMPSLRQLLKSEGWRVKRID